MCVNKYLSAGGEGGIDCMLFRLRREGRRERACVCVCFCSQGECVGVAAAHTAEIPCLQSCPPLLFPLRNGR